MRLIFTIVAFVFCCSASFSQTFNGTGGTIPGTATTPTCFNINVTGVGVINTTTRGLAGICFSINHGDVGDLEITLTAPDGTMVPLTIQNGDAGNNYTNTCFTATATSSIKSGAAPFTGNFLPEGWLGAVNNGQNANGQWRLCIRDRRNPGSSGSLLNWSLNFTTTPAPMPPPIPACANTLPSTSSCTTATLVCDFNGQCGSTAGSSVQTWPNSGLDDCFGLQNNSFIKFVASATTATFSVWVPTTAQTSQQGGIQMMFFSGTCNSGPVTSHGCYPRILPYPAGGQPLVTVVTATNLTPGNTYYLMIDGANNDNCTFTIAANTGVNVLSINPAAPVICEGTSVNLTATGGNGVYSWSPATFLNTTTGATVTSTPPLGTQNYTVTSTTAAGCPLTKQVTVTVNPRPTGITTSALPPDCTSPSGSLTITAPLGTGIQYSVNGGPYQSSPNFPGLPGGASYSVTVMGANGCVSAPITALVPAQCTAPLPVATATAAACVPAASGTVTFTSPLGPNYVYSLYLPGFPIIGPQASPIFTGLTQGNYMLIVKDIVTNCCNTSTVTVAAATLPVAPTASVTAQPTCTLGTGTITVTAPTGAGLQYSINGGPYQASPVFQPLTPGGYTVTVQNTATGCISAASPSVTVAAAPTPPPAPTGSVTAQPTCTTGGTITITAPLGATLQYSINGGPYQSSPVFQPLTPGGYTVTVQNTATGCTSAASQSFTVAAPPTAPPAPTGAVSAQPTCTVGTGAITIAAPLGAGLQYSINGGPYQASPVFQPLGPGSYTVTVQNTATGCTSAPSQSFIVAAQPTAPQAPTGSVTMQPSCSLNSATITISAPTGAGFLYSINGGPYQASPIFTGVTTNNSTVTVQNPAGCTSQPSTPFALTTAVVPPLPTVTAVQPTCAVQTGSITITSPLGSQYAYKIISNGVTQGPQASPVFLNQPPETYIVVVEVVPASLGCENSIIFTLNAPANGPAAPTGSVTAQPTCTPNSSGTITITAPVGPGLQYSIGGAYQASPVFSNLPAGSYNVTVQNAANCISAPSQAFVINPPPGAPSAPTGSVTAQPTCTTGGIITITAPLGAGFQYSFNGSPFLPLTTATGLQPGSYIVTVQNAAGCVSGPSLPFIINAPPTLPNAPTASVTTQPGCSNGGGTITITAPVGANYEYSVNGAAPFQTSPVFNNLPPNSYSVVVRNIVSGCLSQVLPLTVNNGPQPPAAPVFSIVNLNCNSTTGSITITSPLGAGLEYSLDGTTYQTNPVFANLPDAIYQVRVKNAAGCVSAIVPATILPSAGLPPAPAVTLVQPSCPLRMGTITVTAPLGQNIEYSINGTTYQVSPIFSNITNGSFSVTARYIATNCVSASTPAQITGIPAQQCTPPANGDIYFPSAFTPNGDGTNDGFGAGPRSNLSAVTGYTLKVFNRYGEKVFETNDPYTQWNGSYKGKMLANNSFTWVAQYRYGSRAMQMKRGSVIVVR